MTRLAASAIGCALTGIAVAVMALCVVGGAVVAALPGLSSPSHSASARPVGTVVVTGAVPLPGTPSGGYPDDFPAGQCTYWAAFNHRVTWSGDARTWIANAAGAGVRTATAPSTGAIVVWGPRGYSSYGHVGIVVAVFRDSYTVSEMNFLGLGVVDQRTLPWPDPQALGFIP